MLCYNLCMRPKLILLLKLYSVGVLQSVLNVNTFSARIRTNNRKKLISLHAIP